MLPPLLCDHRRVHKVLDPCAVSSSFGTLSCFFLTCYMLAQILSALVV